jgi:hypothetical protein
MELHCPKCNQPILYKQKDFKKGTHHEHECPHCKEFLQWDQPASQTPAHSTPGVSSVEFGPPQACGHEASRRTRPSGLVPYFK